jgi:hypothetical protein
MGAHPHQVVDQFAVLALAMGCKLALSTGMSATNGQVALAVLPSQPVPAVLFHPTLLVVVFGIGGPALSLHLALQAPLLPAIRLQLLAERLELHSPLTREDRQAGWANVQPDRVASCLVLEFLVGGTLQDQLDVEALALAVCSFGVRAAGLAPDESDVLDRLREGVPRQRIGPVDQCGDAILAPEQPAASISCFRLLQEEAHAGIVALALDAVQAPATALESDHPGLTETHAVDRLVSARSQGLRHGGVQVIGEPTLACAFGVRVQAVFGESILLAQVNEGRLTRLLLRSAKGASGLPGWICAHLLQALPGFTQEGIVEATSDFQMRKEPRRLPSIGT